MRDQDLAIDLKRLKLPGMADNLDRRAREAEASKLGYLEFAALLVQDEVASRESNSFQKRLKAAGFTTRIVPVHRPAPQPRCRWSSGHRQVTHRPGPWTRSRTARTRCRLLQDP